MVEHQSPHDIREDRSSCRLTLWTRPFHNLRASRETELVETFPVQVVISWLRNSPTVAMRHYLMTHDSHFEAALQGGSEAAHCAAHNPAQQSHATVRDGSQMDTTGNRETLHFPPFSVSCDTAMTYNVAEEGFEPPTRGL